MGLEELDLLEAFSQAATLAELRRYAEPVNRNESSWALAHPRSMKIGYHAPAAARATSGCLGTAESVMSLTWELSAPRIVAFEHAEQSRAQREAPPGRGHTSGRRRRDGPADRAMLRAGCAPRHRRRVCARAGTERAAAARGAEVRDDRGRAARLARLAGGARGHGCGDGGHGRVLEARVLRARGGLHVSAGQRR